MRIPVERKTERTKRMKHELRCTIIAVIIAACAACNASIEWPDSHGVEDTLPGYVEWRQDEVVGLTRRRLSAYRDTLIDTQDFVVIWTYSICETSSGDEKYCVRYPGGEFNGLTFPDPDRARVYVPVPMPGKDLRDTSLVHELVHAMLWLTPGLSVDPWHDEEPDMWAWLEADLMVLVGELLDELD